MKTQSTLNKLLAQAARLCAILAGVLLVIITIMTCWNLIQRNALSNSWAGAFEITAVSTGAAIALFMPLCQLRQGHIIVDFFTTNMSDSFNDKLDRLGALTLCVVFALLAWRTSLGGLNVYEAHSETQIMGFPEWIVYAAMVPPFILSALIGLHQVVYGMANTTENHEASA